MVGGGEMRVGAGWGGGGGEGREIELKSTAASSEAACEECTQQGNPRR